MRKMIHAVVLAAVAMSGVSTLTACHAGAKAEDETVCLQPKAGAIVTVNQYCAVNNNDPVDPALVVDWKGQKVGFCCKGCLPKWAKMTDTEKEAAVARAVAKGKVPA